MSRCKTPSAHLISFSRLLCAQPTVTHPKYGKRHTSLGTILKRKVVKGVLRKRRNTKVV